MSRFLKLDPNLPLFLHEGAGPAFLYAPGSIAALPREPDRRRALESRMAQIARAALEERDASMLRPFEPLCLTVFPGDSCGLSCLYCYTDHRSTGSAVPLAAVRAAAVRVMRHCTDNGAPFTLVLHGGGEPSFHWDVLVGIVDETKAMARERGLPWFGHVATNGVMDEEKAEWLAAELSSIGLSCDGPPELHDRLRRAKDGAPTSAIVERSARVFARGRAAFETRSTITPATMAEQSRIVRYLIEELGSKSLRFEPLYELGSGTGRGFSPSQARAFADAFLEAQAFATAAGARLLYAGIDLERPRGPFCETARNALHLRSDGSVSSCFFSSSDESDRGRPSRIGAYDPATDSIRIDEDLHRKALRSWAETPVDCEGCFISHACSRDCPESCARIAPSGKRAAGSFRCELNKILAEAWILEAAESLPFADAEVPARRLPEPAWARRGYDARGAAAFAMAADAARRSTATMAIYAHVPYCDRRCSFCDCLSLPLPRDREPVLDAYLGRLESDARAWTDTGKLGSRPVSTLHFGGGSPLLLGPERLGRFVSTLRSILSMTSDTELALETTTSMIDGHVLDELRDIGFSRIHAGIQSLDDGLRKKLGRRESSREALDKLRLALEGGFIVSADFIYGLPGLSPSAFVNGLKEAIDIGIHGFSLYQLQESERNSAFVNRHFPEGRNQRMDYESFVAAEELASASGYRKNHLSHYALEADRDLYYTHAGRGEDRLALGATADGFFGPCAYRHASLEAYLGARSGLPELEGALCVTEAEARGRAMESALMCARVPGSIASRPEYAGLVSSWASRGLLSRAAGNAGEYRLTAEGSWLIADMMEELRGID